MEAEQLVGGDDGDVPLPVDKWLSFWTVLGVIRPIVAIPLVLIYKLLSALLSPLGYVLRVLTAPIVRIASVFGTILMVPFRLIMKFEVRACNVISHGSRTTHIIRSPYHMLDHLSIEGHCFDGLSGNSSCPSYHMFYP